MESKTTVSRASPYLFALTAAAAAIVIRIGLRAQLGQPDLFFYPGVLLVALFAALWQQRGARVEAASRLLRDREAELANAEAASRLAALQLEQCGDATILHDGAGRILDVNQRACEMHGCTREELLAMPLSKLNPALEAPAVQQLLAQLRPGNPFTISREHRRKDGSLIPVEIRVACIEQEGQRMFQAYVRDVSERRRAERQIRESEERYRGLVDQSLAGIYIIQEGRLRYVNPRFAEIFGYGSPAEIIDRIAVAELVAPEDRAMMVERQKVSRPGEGREVRYGFVGLQKDGKRIHVELHGRSLMYEGRPAAIGVMVDVSERKQAELAQFENEERLRQLAETIHEVFFLRELTTGKILYISPAYETIFGQSCESLYSDPSNWAAAIHPEDRERIVEAQRTKQLSGDYDEEFRIVRPDGTVRWIHARAYPVQQADGTVLRIAGVAQDITEQRQLEIQLRQSQRVEAVGRLTGGVAHDFNNLLTVILWRAASLLDELPEGDARREDALGIKAASERAAGLTRQLLAFSRKQVLEPRVLDLNVVIAALAPMLRRLLGEDLVLEIDTAADLGLVKADQGQIEQVIMNLVVNARDAMPAGGRLTLRTSNSEFDGTTRDTSFAISAGRYICFTVSDTGSGMSAEVKEHLFEPFFTTKALGKGTGLGLSTSYGIVKQSGGYIWAVSEPGQGATFQVHLPRIANAGNEAAKNLFRKTSGDERGSETILLMDDDEQVRRAARRILEARGYTVLTAVDQDDAIAMSARHGGKVDLILSDVVMPGASGPEVVEKLKLSRPDMAVLFMSGFTEHAVVDKALAENANFLYKPFTPSTLAGRVREILDGARGS